MTEVNGDHAQDIENHVRAYIDGYCGALWQYVTQGRTIDYDALGYWKFPFLMIGGEDHSCSVSIFDEASFDAMVKPGYEAYYRDGWDGSVKLHSLNVTLASSSVGFAETTGSRYRADGSVNSSWSCLYMLRRTQQGWKHVGVDAALPPRRISDWGDWLVSVAMDEA
ncbi:MAG: hypothetical protein P8J20_17720 [Novosphingobium sp.]|nr:hypothetical protein [Novosphingobium sp.]